MPGADELIAGSRQLLDDSGSPAFLAVVRSEEGEIIPGACAFSTEKPARDQALLLLKAVSNGRGFVVERVLRDGRVRWTVWHGDRDERLHQAFEEAPEAWV